MAPKSTPAAPEKGAEKGERIAKVLSRRGIASRREAERMIAAGEVSVNGKVIDSPALNVTDRDRITISGKALPEKEPARLWLYYKPEGLVTSAADEKGRDTVFDHLPQDMPRVMSVGRLDLNSEGLLLLTNDGELKRRLELPSTGWLRKYRVRVNGNPTDDQLDPLRRGITVDGEKFQPMQVTLDRIQGANAWLTVGLREGRNREIRRAMNAIDLYVNRLIRTSYGPFRLNDLQPGEVEEVRQKVLRDQLGEGAETAEQASGRATAKASAKASAKVTAKPRTGAAAGRKTVKTSGKSTTRRSADEALPRLNAPGDGIKALSRAWKSATTPAAPARDEASARDGAQPRRGSGPAAKPAGSGRVFGTAKPSAKPAGKPAARSTAGKPPSGKPPAGKPPSGKPRTRG
ncbi:MAG: pseudouridine synthase [Paracoccaceae bacterium]